MVQLQKSRFGTQFGVLSWRKVAPVIAMLTLCLGTTGCVSLENEEGRLPRAMRASIATLSAKGYPDLTKIPDAPTDLPTAANWTSLEAGLVAQGNTLSTDPMAVPPTTDEANLGWAKAAQTAFDGDPRAQPLPPVQPGSENDVSWAAAAKAKLEADLARLPPP
jgi:hypothetical protein